MHMMCWTCCEKCPFAHNAMRRTCCPQKGYVSSFTRGVLRVCQDCSPVVRGLRTGAIWFVERTFFDTKCVFPTPRIEPSTRPSTGVTLGKPGMARLVIFGSTTTRWRCDHLSGLASRKCGRITCFDEIWRHRISTGGHRGPPQEDSLLT